MGREGQSLLTSKVSYWLVAVITCTRGGYILVVSDLDFVLLYFHV